MKLNKVFGLGLTTVLAISVICSKAAYVNAVECPVYNEVAASESYRTFHYKKHNLSFELPSNYHVVTYDGRNLEVQSLHAYQEIQCLIRNKIGTDNLPNIISFYIEEAPSDLDTWIAEKLYAPEEYKTVTMTNLGGRTALQYYTEGPTGFMTNISVLAPNGKYIITLSTHQSDVADEEYDAAGNLISARSIVASEPEDAEVFNKVLSSFHFTN